MHVSGAASAYLWPAEGGWCRGTCHIRGNSCQLVAPVVSSEQQVLCCSVRMLLMPSKAEIVLHAGT
jgi:hypothetical protein